MLYLLGAWVLLLAVSVPTGAAIVRWTSADEVFDRLGDRLILCAWLGLLVLGSGLLAASLLFPLSPLVGAVFGLAAVAAALSWRPAREEIALLRARLDRRLIVAFLGLAAGVALLTAQPVVWFDTGLYHASAIRWLSEFGAVDGIALVHYRLGFASSWFALAAPFNPEGLRDHAVAVMGGFALLLLSLHALICLSRALKRTARLADWLLIAGAALLIPGLALLQKVNVSPSPDLPVNILGLLVGWTIFTIADAPRGRSLALRSSPGPAAVPLLLALGAMTVKPQAAALVAVAALFYLAAGGGRLRRLLWIGQLGVLFTAPWLAYELVATGCPAYPLPICADVAWSVGSDAARNAAETAQSFSRWRVEPAPGSGLGWVGPWLTDDLSPALAALALVSVLAVAGGVVTGSNTLPATTARRTATWAVIAGAIGLLLFLLRSEEILMVTMVCLSLIPVAQRCPGSGWLLALGLSGIVLTLYAAPDPRFAFGYMAVLFGRLVVFQGPALWTRLRPYLDPPGRLPEVRLTTLLLVGGVAAALGPFVRPTTPASEGPELLIPEVPTASVAVFPRSGIQYRVPTEVAQRASEGVPGPNGLCWAAELPCTLGYEIDPEVVLRDPSQGIAEGFRKVGR